MKYLVLLFIAAQCYAMPGGHSTYKHDPSPGGGVPSQDPHINPMPDMGALFGGGTTHMIGRMATHQNNALQAASSQSSQLEAQVMQLRASMDTKLAGTDTLLSQAKPKDKKLLDLDSIPDPQVPYQFASQDAETRRLYTDLYKSTPQFGKQKLARELGLLSAQEADQAFSINEQGEGNFYKDLAKEFLDIVVGIDPVSGMGRSTYELFSGRNLVTGASLNAFDRSMAFVGVVTLGGSKGITQATKGMWKVFNGASHLLKDRAAIELAMHEGTRLMEKVPHLLDGWKKRHHITGIHSAEHINGKYFAHWKDTPPFQIGTHVIEFLTRGETKWVRVHGELNQEGRWLMRKNAIEGLTPQQLKDKYNLPELPKYWSEVHVPDGSRLFRGNIQDHGSGVFGDVQYWAEQYADFIFKPRKPL